MSHVFLIVVGCTLGLRACHTQIMMTKCGRMTRLSTAEGVANEILDTYPNAEPYKLLMFCLERWKKNQEGEVLCEPTAAVMVSLLERCGMPAIARWYQSKMHVHFVPVCWLVH